MFTTGGTIVDGGGCDIDGERCKGQVEKVKGVDEECSRFLYMAQPLQEPQAHYLVGVVTGALLLGCSIGPIFP